MTGRVASIVVEEDGKTFSAPPEGWPPHLQGDDAATLRWMFIRWANMERAYWGEPVYLVGSALAHRDPRDWDVRVVISDKDFTMRYLHPTFWERERATGAWTSDSWRWADDCVKNSRQARQHTMRNVDFQVHPESHAARYAGQPRLQIDTRP